MGQIALFTVMLGCGLTGPATMASVSDASIKAVIKSYNSKVLIAEGHLVTAIVLIAEGHLVTAIGEYKKSGSPAKVQTAIQKETSVLLSLESKIKSQSASSPRVKLGKAKFVKGLQKVVVAYRHLGKAFGEAKKAVSIIKNARVELREGAKLLS